MNLYTPECPAISILSTCLILSTWGWVWGNTRCLVDTHFFEAATASSKPYAIKAIQLSCCRPSWITVLALVAFSQFRRRWLSGWITPCELLSNKCSRKSESDLGVWATIQSHCIAPKLAILILIVGHWTLPNHLIMLYERFLPSRMKLDIGLGSHTEQALTIWSFIPMRNQPSSPAIPKSLWNEAIIALILLKTTGLSGWRTKPARSNRFCHCLYGSARSILTCPSHATMFNISRPKISLSRMTLSGASGGIAISNPSYIAE